jgi:hypothetical protein
VVHHVAIEARSEDIERLAELFGLLGFERVEPPPTLTRFTWLERSGTQIHLLPTESPTVPPSGHVAVTLSSAHLSPNSDENCALGFDEVVEGLREAGFEVEPRSEHWGSPRVKIAAPGGHVVEVMEFPPKSENP